MSDFWKTVKSIHFNPTKFYEDLDGEGFLEASKFVASVGLIFGLLVTVFGLISTIVGQTSVPAFIILTAIILIGVPFILIVSAFFQAALAHFGVYLFGERGFDTTYNAIAYPVSAVLLWRWIPILNIIAGIYSIYLQTKGVEILHDMDFGKALVAVIWPVILSIFITTALVIFAVLIGFGTTIG